MLDTLSSRLRQTVKQLRGHAVLTEKHIDDTLREIRRTLIEADVVLPVIRQLTEEIRAEAVGQKVMASLTPAQQLIRIIQNKLLRLLEGEQKPALNLHTQPPAVILLAGLQGSGKTTSAAKLARQLRAQKKKVLTVSVDVYRPAAREQLAILAQQAGVSCWLAEELDDPIDIAISALQEAKRRLYDVLIVDTAGRLHIDDAMMAEIRQLQDTVKAIEVLFVSDAQTGQDAVNSARSFASALPLTGLIMTRVDGDSRGGAILSARSVTGCAIKYLATGEKLENLEAFDGVRVVSRILGMGDIAGMMKDIEQSGDQHKVQQALKNARKGVTMIDLRDQLQQLQKMGGMASIMEKIPGGLAMKNRLRGHMNDKTLRLQLAIIDSMTAEERLNPEIIKRTRKLRIASGSGTSAQLVNQLLQQQRQMSSMMKSMKKGGGKARHAGSEMQRMIRGMRF